MMVESEQGDGQGMRASFGAEAEALDPIYRARGGGHSTPESRHHFKCKIHLKYKFLYMLRAKIVVIWVTDNIPNAKIVKNDC